VPVILLVQLSHQCNDRFLKEYALLHKGARLESQLLTFIQLVSKWTSS